MPTMSTAPVDTTSDAAKWLTRLGRDATPEAVAALAPFVRRDVENGSPEARAWANLVRNGKLPTPEAVQRLVDRWAAAEKIKRSLDEDVARRVVDFIAEHLKAAGTGPAWSQVCTHMGWSRAAGEVAMPTLRRAGWVVYTAEPGSLRPGPRQDLPPADVLA